MKKKISLEELIVEMMPFSDGLVDWCKSHPEFLEALKIVYSEKFISLGVIVTSYSPNYPNDQVIGVYTYDYQRKNPIFKQDFIVNKGSLDKEFILFTRNFRGRSSKYVKDINEFYATYGKGGNYVNSHHLSFEQLPEEMKPRGLDAIKLANKLKGGIMIKPSQKRISKIYKQVKSIKKGVWFEKQKLRENS